MLFVDFQRLVAANHDDAVQVANYVRKARMTITHKAAAVAWANGVPWGHALAIAKKAVASGNAAVRKPLATRKGKGKGKSNTIPKGKGKGT